MEKTRPTTPELKTSRTWERLEDFVREHVQQFIQDLLEEEVTELLGRTKSTRREAVDARVSEWLWQAPTPDAHQWDHHRASAPRPRPERAVCESSVAVV
jgi:hypothetical protein